MPLRTFVDAAGVTWRVWKVEPGNSSIPAAVVCLPEEMQGGWLCFECDREKRRLRPVPRSWEARTDAELDILRRAAEPVPR